MGETATRVTATARPELFSFDGPRPDVGRLRRIPYRPALDGIRAVAVLAVLVYHQNPARLPGGFLGVDVFFALSGYLITSLLLAEHAGSGRIDLRRFWIHRARRLLPALLLCLLLVGAYAHWIAPEETLDQLRGDAAATLAYVLNWRFVLEGRSYFFEFFPSPLRHLWSLAVEEQWYLLWPLVVWAVLRGRDGRGGRGAARVAVTAALLAMVSAIEMAWLFTPGADASRAYYGTDAHASPLLVGAAVGAVVAWRRLPSPSGRTWRAYLPGAAGVLGAVVLLWAFVNASGNAPWLYRGGFALVALAAVGVVLAGFTEGGPAWRNPVRWVLALAPLAALGRISYGMYLFHWPLYFVLTPERTGTVGWRLFAIRLAATTALATASYLAIERPIRSGALTRLRISPLLLPGAVALVALAMLSATAGSSAPWLTRDDLDVADRPAPSVPTTQPGAPPEDRLSRVLVVGDSVAYTLAIGFEDDVAADADLVVWNQAVLYCELVDLPRREGGAGGEERAASDACDDWEGLWSAAVDEFDPDVVVVQVGPWEVFDRREGSEWVPFGSPRHDELLTAELTDLVEVVGADGATVALLTVPGLERTDGVSAEEWTAEDRWRTDHLDELLRSVATEAEADGRPVEVLDLAGLVCPGDDGSCPERIDGVRVRGDGIHYTDEGGRWAARWLAPQLRALALEAADRS